MNIIVNEINTQVRFGSNRPLPVPAKVFISLLYCFCAVQGNVGFSDCRGGERSWSVCSGWTQWTGGQAGTTVRASARFLIIGKLHLQYAPALSISSPLGCWRFCRGRELEKTAASREKPTAWHEGQKWRLCCSSTASLSHPLRNKATTYKQQSVSNVYIDETFAQYELQMSLLVTALKFSVCL